jgi:hypothetical protein
MPENNLCCRAWSFMKSPALIDTPVPANRNALACHAKQKRYTRCGAEPRAKWRSSAAAMNPAVKLHGHEPRVVFQLDHLNQRAVGTGARGHQPVGSELLPVNVIELIAMAVALGDYKLAVASGRLAAFHQVGRLGS